jgi:hypothetical protein
MLLINEFRVVRKPSGICLFKTAKTLSVSSYDVNVLKV